MPEESNPIYVTKPSLPPLEEIIPHLEKVWESRVLTNGGPYHQELERRLCEYLEVPYISLFSNATIALVTAIKALGLKGEVITTPYSFVATAHALLWNGIKPVFVDIDPKTNSIDPSLIEEAITPNTTGILPVHVYGIPCDADRIDEIAKKHNLKVIYDAAHAFGVKCHCGSILNHGDYSVLSFHATKVFNTFEGGAIVCQTIEQKEHIDKLKNFGFANEISVVETGINGKMNEIQAIIGLAQLDHIDEQIAARRVVDEYYRAILKDVEGIRFLDIENQEAYNYSYFPIFIEDNYPLTRDELYFRLRDKGIYARRYFYPLITEFEMYRNLQNSIEYECAIKASKSVICLPIYCGLDLETLEDVIHLIIKAQ